jgi:amidase
VADPALVAALAIEGAKAGPLAPLTFAVKDNIDVAGVPTGNGCADWQASHPVPSAHAPIVTRLLGAGAQLIGKAAMDELAFSLIGDTRKSPAPFNPQAPGRYCGGSSCGSASAVAQGLADFALGTDTAGSIRIPASFCGLWGLRPTHGLIPMAGVAPLAPPFDTLGWIASSGETLLRVTEAVSPHGQPIPKASRLVWPEWAFVRQPPMLRAASHRAGRQFAEAQGLRLIDHTQEPAWFAGLAEIFAKAQRAAVAKTLGPWVKARQPNTAPEISERLMLSLMMTAGQCHEAIQRAAAIRAAIQDLVQALGHEAVLLWPTSGSVPLSRRAGLNQRANYRQKTLDVTAFASLGGVPELTAPWVHYRGLHLGLSLIGPAGSDQWLAHQAVLPSHA